MVLYWSYSFRLLSGIGLLPATAIPGLAQTPSPRDVVERFCKLDAQGEQLSPAGWNKLAALFVNPGARRIDGVMVIRDCVVGRPHPEEGRVVFGVACTPLGEIDSAEARFSPIPPEVKVKGGFSVIKQPGRGSAESSRPNEELAEWRIEGPMPGPRLSVDAAIRYVAELRRNASNDTIGKNAEKALASLKRYRKTKRPE